MLNIKFRTLKIDKQISSLDEINPLTLTIAEISKLSKNVAIVNKAEKQINDKNYPQNNFESKETMVRNISKLIKEKIPKEKDAEEMI